MWVTSVSATSGIALVVVLAPFGVAAVAAGLALKNAAMVGWMAILTRHDFPRSGPRTPLSSALPFLAMLGAGYSAHAGLAHLWAVSRRPAWRLLVCRAARCCWPAWRPWRPPCACPRACAPSTPSVERPIRIGAPHHDGEDRSFRLGARPVRVPAPVVAHRRGINGDHGRARGGLSVVRHAPFHRVDTVFIDMQAAAPFKGDNTPIDSQFANGIAESQVEVLQSDGLARVVVNRLHLADNQAFMANGNSLMNTILAFCSRRWPRR